MSHYYPQYTTKDDLDYIEGGDNDLLKEQWWEANEEELTEEFLKLHYPEDVLTKLWEKFIEAKWEAYLNEVS